MKCDHCGSDKTNLSHGKPYWKKYPEHFKKDTNLRICVRCSSSFRYYGEKHDEILSKQKARRDENKVTINKDRKIQYAANSEPAKQRAKRRYAENPELVKEEHKKNLKNQENRDNSNRNHNKTRLRKRHLVMEILGGIKCSKCNFDNYSALQLHHNDDAGGKERSEFSESTKLTERIANPEKTKKELTVLCTNCHRLIPIKKKTSTKTFKTPQKIRERNALDARNRRKELKSTLLKLLGGPKCIECGFSNVQCLDFEHKKGGGSAEKNQFGGFSEKRMKYWIENISDTKKRIQIMCANCNQIKKAIFNEY